MPVSRIVPSGFLLLLVLVSPMLMGQGCGSVTVTLPPGDDSDADGPLVPSAVNTVLVRFVNRHAELGVDLEFFATSGPVTDFETELFIDENQVTAVGLFGRGVVPGMDTDDVELPCGDAMIIGTRGGEFLDSETGEVIGRGKQFVFSQNESFSCGDVITFEFLERNGEFTTEVEIR